MLKPDLYMILRHARKNNEARDITGLLVYSDEHFFQILFPVKNIGRASY